MAHKFNEKYIFVGSVGAGEGFDPREVDILILKNRHHVGQSAWAMVQF
jgi:hypothetical protein